MAYLIIILINLAVLAAALYGTVAILKGNDRLGNWVAENARGVSIVFYTTLIVSFGLWWLDASLYFTLFLWTGVAVLGGGVEYNRQLRNEQEDEDGDEPTTSCQGAI
ncbi:MAG: hypothetical protein ACR2N7_04995 [Acidimicrobiia bacterium]